jgi:hypothetical protein
MKAFHKIQIIIIQIELLILEERPFSRKGNHKNIYFQRNGPSLVSELLQVWNTLKGIHHEEM